MVDGDDKKQIDSQDSEDAKRRVRTFDENLEALLEYKKEHGNVDVPQKCAYATYQLGSTVDYFCGTWVSHI